jgi:ABC-type glycerol-3-phosphate transport system permease component
MFPLIRVTQLIPGTLLLAGRLVPLALTLLAPVIVSIVAFHLFLEPSGLALPILVLALEIFLARSYWSAFRSVVRVRVAPDGADEVARPAATSSTSS